jgi:hypothetical protein
LKNRCDRTAQPLDAHAIEQWPRRSAHLKCFAPTSATRQMGRAAGGYTGTARPRRRAERVPERVPEGPAAAKVLRLPAARGKTSVF